MSQECKETLLAPLAWGPLRGCSEVLPGLPGLAQWELQEPGHRAPHRVGQQLRPLLTIERGLSFSHVDILSVLMTWQLVFPRADDPERLRRL